MVPVVSTGTRLRNRNRAPRRSRYPEVAPGASISRQARDRYATPDACRVHDRSNDTTARSLWNPALALALIPGHLSGCLPTGRLDDRFRLHRLDDDELLSDRLGDDHELLFSVPRRLRSRKTHCALLTRNALTARTKQYGLTSRSSGTSTCLWACRSHVAAYVYSIPMDRCD